MADGILSDDKSKKDPLDFSGLSGTLNLDGTVPRSFLDDEEGEDNAWEGVARTVTGGTGQVQNRNAQYGSDALAAGAGVASIAETLKGLQSSIDSLGKASGAMQWAGFGVDTALSIYSAVMSRKNYKLAKENLKHQKRSYAEALSNKKHESDKQEISDLMKRSGMSHDEAAGELQDRGVLSGNWELKKNEDGKEQMQFRA